MRSRVFACLALALATTVGSMSAQAPGSPHDTVSATVDGVKVSIEYGRPFMRGRKIVGGLVPYGRVWRTGADQSTTLTTAAPLVIGGTAVPAGKVSLYTLPSPQGWKLIINKQTGQWGTEYDQAQDLARVDLIVKTLAAPVDQFTIEIDGGQIRLAWEMTELAVPIKKG
ncbi:MAG: DUF2911 domain-containing protein [Vicinamibacteria bacterium]|nr:DUF2911 domain-containing protein [Vicinamibacteria bacterium]